MLLGSTMAQYFIEVVPTDIYSFLSHIKTYQYTVKENIRPISISNIMDFISFDLIAVFFIDFIDFTDHGKGSHGVPGLYFKYDVSALKVVVQQDRKSFMQFLIRLSSVVAGIIVISGELRIQFILLSLSINFL